MRAVVLGEDNKLSLREIPRPRPRHGEVLIKVGACGICGSDLRYLHGENPWAQQTLGVIAKNPGNLVLGHEFAGEVVEAADARDEHLLGKRVVGIAYKGCGVCEFCRSNRENLCKATQHIGHGAGWEEMPFYPGAMADYTLAWSPLYEIGDGLSYAEASTVDFMAIGLSAVKKAERVFAEDVAVIGSGPVGLGVLEFALLMGARRVYCVDVARAPLQVAEQLGGVAVDGADIETLAERILDLTDGVGVSAVFDTVGSPDTQRQGLLMLQSRGSFVSLVANGVKRSFPLFAISGERSIQTVANSPVSDMYQTIRLLEAERLSVKPLITHTLPLNDFMRGFELLENRAESGALKVVLIP